MANDSILIQVQLGTPTRANINAVTRQIQGALSNVNANVQIQNGRQATQTLQNIKSKTDAATKSTTSFADAIGLSARRFVAFTSAVAVVGRLTSALSQATREAIKFEREFVKLAQVFDTDVRSLGNLQNSVSDLSKEFGLSATVIAKTSVVLAQSGLTARQTEQAMKTLAKTTLAATFDSIASSTEGAVAIMAQFGTEANKLEAQLGAINAVSKKFAVESGDIIEAVRRAGGAFRAAGGNLNEFISLFTAVRSTTRESAETIATGFRTIFARLQRPKTIDFFRQLNIELTDGRGNFIGAFEAVRRLSKGLEEAGIKAGSIKFAGVVEQLGGIRQVSRVIPLLQQFTKAEKARQVAIGGAGSLDRDAAKAQETLAQSFARTTENFRALIREITQTATFQAIVKVALDLANAFIEVARSLKPLIPLIAAFGSIKLGGLVSGAIRSGFGGAGGTGGLGKGFKRGGPVPGTGSGDTVPAMLEPGEFVIRKSAVNAFGADRLAGINKYANPPKGQRGVRPNKRGIGLTKIKDNPPTNALSLSKINKNTTLSNSAKGALKGFFFENDFAIANGITKIGGSGVDDFPDVRGPAAKSYAQDLVKRKKLTQAAANRVQQLELKHDDSSPNISRYKAGLKRKKKTSAQVPLVHRFAGGGSVGTDTVPALLTPGEFVINKKSAESFGYSRLDNINKYAKGGPVQKFANGGDVGGGGGFGKLTTVLFILPQLLSTLAESIGGANSEIGKFLKAFGNSFLAIAIIAAGIKQLKTTVSDFVKTIGKKDRIVESKKKAADAITRTGEGISSAGDGVGKGLKETLEVIQFFNAEIRTATGRKKDELKKKKDALFEGTGVTSERALKKKIRDEGGPPRDERGFAGGDNRTTRAAFDKFEAEKKARRHAATAAAGGTLKDAGETEGGFGRGARGAVQAGRRKLRGSAAGKAFDKVLTGGSKALAKLPGPIGAVVKGLKVLNAVALVVTAGFIGAFKVAGENAKKASEEAIKEGKVGTAQREALRSLENEKNAKDLTVASGVVQGFLGPLAGLVQPFLVLASATGVLGKAFDAGKRVFNGFIKGMVGLLDSLGLVDSEIRDQILGGLVDPAVERQLKVFQAGVDASTQALKNEVAQRKKLFDQQVKDLKLIQDQGKFVEQFNTILTDFTKEIAPPRNIAPNLGSANQAAISTVQTAKGIELLRQIADGAVGVSVLKNKEGAFVALDQATKDAAQILLKASKEQQAVIQQNIDNILGGFSQVFSGVGGDLRKFSKVLGISREQLRLVNVDGFSVLSHETIFASDILKRSYTELVNSGKEEIQARKEITRSLLGEANLRQALAADLAIQQKAFVGLLESFTFGSDESRQQIGQDIEAVQRLVNSGNDINSPQIASEDRGRILSFLKSAPGARFQGPDGRVQRSEDIVVETIRKQFEGQGLSNTVLLGEEGRKQAEASAESRFVDEFDFSTDQETFKTRILAEEQNKLIEKGIRDQLFPEQQQLIVLRDIYRELQGKPNKEDVAKDEAAERELDKLTQVAVDADNVQVGNVTNLIVESVEDRNRRIDTTRNRLETNAIAKIEARGGSVPGDNSRGRTRGTRGERAFKFNEEQRAAKIRQKAEDEGITLNTGETTTVGRGSRKRKVPIRKTLTQLIKEILTQDPEFQTTLDRYKAGGPIYASQGTLVNMQPQGTDTVPAMLTPGEFVINAQSASRLGLGTLTAMNNYAKGGPVKYFNQAGGVKPLTPKELEELEEENKRLRANAVNRFQSDTNEAIGGIRPGDARSRILYGEQYAGTRREIFNSRRRLSQRNIAAYEGMGRGKDNTSPTLDESLARAKERVRPIQHSTGTRSREDSFSAGGGNFGKVRIGNRLVNRFGPTQKAPDSVRAEAGFYGGSSRAGRFGPYSQQEEKDFQDAKAASAKRARSITSEFGGAGAVIGEDGSFQGFMDGMSSSDPTATAEQLRSAYRQKQFKRAVATGGSYAYSGGRSRASIEAQETRRADFANELQELMGNDPRLKNKKRAAGILSRRRRAQRAVEQRRAEGRQMAQNLIEAAPGALRSVGTAALGLMNTLGNEFNLARTVEPIIGQTPTTNITDQAGLDQVARNQEISLGTPQTQSFQQETANIGQNLVIPRPAPPPLAEPIPRPEYSPAPPQTSILQELNPPKRQSPLSPAAPPLPEPRVAPVPMPDPFKNLFNKGGPVGRSPQYLNRGGSAGGGGVDASALNSFANNFGSSVSQLVGSAITLEVAPMGVNINLNGAELLAQLPQMVQRMVIGEIQSELSRFEQTRDFNNTPGAYASSILA